MLRLLDALQCPLVAPMGIVLAALVLVVHSIRFFVVLMSVAVASVLEVLIMVFALLIVNVTSAKVGRACQYTVFKIIHQKNIPDIFKYHFINHVLLNYSVFISRENGMKQYSFDFEHHQFVSSFFLFDLYHST